MELFIPPAHKNLPYSFGIDQALLTFLSENPTVDLAAAVRQAYRLAYDAKEVRLQLPSLVKKAEERIGKLNEQLKAGGKPASAVPMKTLGSTFAEWVSNLKAEETCLYLADFDPKRAYDYYWFTELAHVEAALHLKIAHASQMSVLGMEQAMYGAGNRYNDDDSSAKLFDLSSGEGLGELKKLGF